MTKTNQRLIPCVYLGCGHITMLDLIAIGYLRRVAIRIGITITAHPSTAADIKPAGVARPVAVTEAHLPRLNVTVPFISSG